MNYKQQITERFRDVTPQERAAIMRVYVEYGAARQEFGGFASEYEAYGVIREEFNEFWHLVQHHDKPWAGADNMKSEIQAVAAMAVAYLLEIKPGQYDLVGALNGLFNRYKNPNPKYPKVKSAHEAYAIMLEELDGLWELIRNSKSESEDRITKDQRVINVGARALRFLIEM